MSRRPIRALACLVIAGLVLAACGDGDDADPANGEDAGAANGEEPVTIVVWDRAGPLADARQGPIQEWSDQQDDLNVEYVPQALEEYDRIVRTGFQTGETPDVFHSVSGDLGGFAAAGFISPLGGLVDEGHLEAMAPYSGETSELFWGGELYALPSVGFTIRFLYNADLFEEAGLDPDVPPETFSEVLDAARQISENTDAHGSAVPIAWAGSVGFVTWFVDPLVMATDGDLAQHGMFNMQTQEFEAERYLPVIEFYRELLDYSVPGASEMGAQELQVAFAEGQAGIVPAMGEYVRAIEGLNDELDIRVARLPIADGESMVRSPMNAGFPYSIVADTEHPEQAARVLAFLTGAEMQGVLAEDDVPPLLPDAWSSVPSSVLAQFEPDDLDEQWPKKPASVMEIRGDSHTDILVRLILDPSADAESALRELSETYQAAYESGIEDGILDPDEFSG